MYVQKKELRIDIRLPVDRSDEIVASGFKIRHTDNFQAKAGWVTGLRAPHDTKKRVELVDLLLEALQDEDRK